MLYNLLSLLWLKGEKKLHYYIHPKRSGKTVKGTIICRGGWLFNNLIFAPSFSPLHIRFSIESMVVFLDWSWRCSSQTWHLNGRHFRLMENPFFRSSTYILFALDSISVYEEKHYMISTLVCHFWSPKGERNFFLVLIWAKTEIGIQFNQTENLFLPVSDQLSCHILELNFPIYFSENIYGRKR